MWLGSRSDHAARGRLEPGLVLGASLACCVLLADGMLWLDVWWPTAFIYLLAVVCLAVIVREAPLSASAIRASRRRLGDTRRRVREHSRSHCGDRGGDCPVGRVADGAHLDRMAGLGLLDAMPPPYFLAFALLLAALSPQSPDRFSRSGCWAPTSWR